MDDGSAMSMQRDEQYCATLNGQVLGFDDGECLFYDNLTKQQLPTPLVKAARQKELDDVETKNVWKRVSMAEAHRISGRPPFTVRWVDVNKGDNDCPVIRSRLVARQIRGANEDPMSAPIPPLEALRTVLRHFATDMDGERIKCRADRRTRSSFHWWIFLGHTLTPSVILTNRRLLHCQLRTKTIGPYVACYSSTCTAPRQQPMGQQEYIHTMIELGFRQGVACPCVFWHESRSLVSSVHGDDFTNAGAKPDLDWFESALEAKYELRKG